MGRCLGMDIGVANDPDGPPGPGGTRKAGGEGILSRTAAFDARMGGGKMTVVRGDHLSGGIPQFHIDMGAVGK
jgi:hypothetical protein